MRRWRGQVPPGGVLVSAYRHAGSFWALFARDQRAGWQNFKLAADFALGKANYWLGWNDKRRELAHWPDASALRKQLPEVYEWVLDECDAYDASRVQGSVIVSDYSLPEDRCTRIVDRGSLVTGCAYVSQIGLRVVFEGDTLPPIGGNTESCFEALGERGGGHIAPFLSEKGQCVPPRDGLPADISDLL
jgi:hypothetical protein